MQYDFILMQAQCAEQIKSALRAGKTLHDRTAWFEVQQVS